jgi:hypothetical protein
VLLAALVACHADPEEPCAPSARPDSIDDAIDAIGLLPSPVTLTCFLSSLERPLGVELTSDPFSAQPALGERSPRTFVRTEHLTLSVVPDGEAADLLELAEHYDDEHTVKAEIAFPVELPLDPAAPFERVQSAPGAPVTRCKVCHFDEIDIGGGRFASTPLAPPLSTLVSVDELQAERDACDPSEEPSRCAMLAAILDHGEVDHAPFPDDYFTLGGG